MKKKILAIAIAGAMATPSAFAAVDTSGMQYTSASEGFYASVRARWDSGTGTKNGDSGIYNSSNRIGVRGSSDLGGGLEGFYTSELSVPLNNGDNVSVRVGEVGLRGGFGELRVGSFWSNDYNWTFGSTDVANWASGNFAYSGSDGRQGRVSSALQYTTPDLNGFQGALRLNANGEGNDNNANDLNAWNVSAKYDVQGFTVGGSYNSIVDGHNTVAAVDAQGVVTAVCVSANPDIRGTADRTPISEHSTKPCPTGSSRFLLSNPAIAPLIALIPEGANSEIAAVASVFEDVNSWTARLGYAQDNWYVNGWYGKTDNGVPAEERDLFSVAGGVSLDKVSLYAMYETDDPESGDEDSFGVIGVQYNFSSQMRIWAEYGLNDGVTNDRPGDTGTSRAREDSINIGLRHDF